MSQTVATPPPVRESNIDPEKIIKAVRSSRQIAMLGRRGIFVREVYYTAFASEPGKIAHHGRVFADADGSIKHSVVNELADQTILIHKRLEPWNQFCRETIELRKLVNAAGEEYKFNWQGIKELAERCIAEEAAKDADAADIIESIEAEEAGK
ncbi:MAG TPA: hypothetical protein V6C76_11475 [Drouetiella sp.]